jgi:hypothetical protein
MFVEAFEVKKMLCCCVEMLPFFFNFLFSHSAFPLFSSWKLQHTTPDTPSFPLPHTPCHTQTRFPTFSEPISPCCAAAPPPGHGARGVPFRWCARKREAMYEPPCVFRMGGGEGVRSVREVNKVGKVCETAREAGKQ